MSDPSVTILYENGPCLVVLKPAGIATQAPPGIDSLEVRVKCLLAQRRELPGNVYLGVPHRLDRPVSGAVVLGLHSRAAKRLARQFEHRTIKKLYWACVEGIVQPDAGTWRDLVFKVPNVPQAQIMPPGEVDRPPGVQAREAVLHYRTLRQTPHGAWLEIELETGRYHQIRVQAASRGHPVLGDEMYGSRVPFGEQHEDRRLRAIALHARQLSLSHPMTREPLTVIAPLGDAWESLGSDADKLWPVP
jgi:23S rRNA pseudouridine1911/1915/1917 synthase